MSNTTNARPSGKPVKVLVCGDIEGKFHKLFSQVQAINSSKSGPFDVLFCVGKFFSTDDAKVQEYGGAEDANSQAYITGRKEIPVPTYIVDGGSGSDLLESMPRGGEICPNLNFLGKCGVADVAGLKVAYLSGLYDPFCFRGTTVETVQNYREDDIRSLASTLNEMNKSRTQIDVLLTSEWPRNILNHVRRREGEYPQLTMVDESTGKKSNKNFATVGSPAVTEVLKSASPRYHFAALEGVFYQRPPYKNVSKEGKASITRFIALAPISDSKEKHLRSLYAAALTPVSSMTDEQLANEPPNTTHSPFDLTIPVDQMGQERTAAAAAAAQAANVRDHKRPRQQQHQANPNLQHKKPRHQQQQPGECWFCFSAPNFEKHLVVSIGDESYVALPKGGITPDHVLILSLTHSPSFTSLSDSAEDEMERYKDALRKMFAKQGKSVVIFERNVWPRNAPQHMMLQVVPVPNSITADQCREAFEREGAKQQKCKITFEHFPASETKSMKDALIKAGCENSPYFLVELPDKSYMVHKVPPEHAAEHPLQFGRIVCASEILGLKERAHWKNCQSSMEEEAELAKKFRASFKDFDFTL